MTKKEIFNDAYADHMETWGPHCGAPKLVYKGHLDKLLLATRDYCFETITRIARREIEKLEEGL
jgi:hypothetical protein